MFQFVFKMAALVTEGILFDNFLNLNESMHIYHASMTYLSI